MTKIKVRKDHDDWDEREVDSDRLDRNPDEASESPSDDGGDMPDVSEMDGDSTESDGEGPEGDADGDGPASDDLPLVRWRLEDSGFHPHYGDGDGSGDRFADRRSVALLLDYYPPRTSNGKQFVTIAEAAAASDDFKACVVAREVTVPQLREELKNAEDVRTAWANTAKAYAAKATRKDRLLEKLVGVLDAMAEEADADYLAGWVDKIMAEINPQG